MNKIDALEIEIFSDKQVAQLEKVRNLLDEIICMRNDIASSLENENTARAVQGAIDFKTKSGIRYITYSQNGEKILVLTNTEDSSTIAFKVESVKGGIHSENFHPEAMFRPIKAQQI